jgi:hypothetical protein
MNQLEQLKAEAQDELEVAVMGLINRFVLDNCGKEIACMSRGQFVVPQLVKESLSTLIETVYQARTEEIVKIAGSQLIRTPDGRVAENDYNFALVNFVATLKDTKISKDNI